MKIADTQPPGTSARPRFSVIIPAHDCAEELRRCLVSLAQSDFTDFECIVVDDGSLEPLDSVVSGHAAHLIRLDQRGGPARARNRGAAAASGEVLAFFDADVCVHADALRRFDAHFAAHPETTAIMGSYDRTPTDPGFVSQFKNLFHHYIHHHSHREASTFWAACMLRDRSMPSDLNLTLTHRLSVMVIWVLIALAVLATFAAVPHSRLSSGVAAITLLLLNLNLYRFFARERGLWFAARALPLHWLYYAYCGLAVGLAVAIHLRKRITARCRSRVVSLSQHQR